MESIGLEPIHQFLDDGLANRSINRSGNSPKCLAGLRGLEPRTTESKSVVLPLHYNPINFLIKH